MPIFDPQNVTTLYYPALSRFISIRLFSVPQVELHFADVAEIQETVTDDFKKVQREEFSAGFQKLYEGKEAFIYASGAYFE